MKHVYASDRIPHLWMHKLQDSARNSQGNFFFEGDTIYSYGNHFPIARHVTLRGQQAILFTTDKYSVTTAEHIRLVHRAIPNTANVFTVSYVTRKPTANTLDEIQERINEAAMAASRARAHKEFHLEDMNRAVDEFERFAKFVGSKRKPKLPDDKWLANQKAKARKQIIVDRETQAKHEALRAVRLAEQRLKDKETIDAWLAGEDVNFPYSYVDYKDGAYMRIKGDTIETSQGATVPTEHARRIAPLIVKLLANGETYQRNGHSIFVGEFVIESLDAEGMLTVGCHRFNKAELLRIAALLEEGK